MHSDKDSKSPSTQEEVDALRENQKGPHQFTDTEIVMYGVEFAVGLGLGTGAVATGVASAPIWITAALAIGSAAITIHTGYQTYQWGKENIEAYMNRYKQIEDLHCGK
jgi:hypothetical protein